jgi:hypothetical protein
MLVALFLSGSTRPVYGSLCTKGPITIQVSRSQTSASTVAEPFLFTRFQGVKITVGKVDAFRIVTERSKENAAIAKTTSLLLPIMEKLPPSEKAVDASSIHPRLRTLKGKELADGVLVENELMVLFLRALEDGSAKIDAGPSSLTPETVIQQYSAVVPKGYSLSGVRVMQGNRRVYDYCGLTKISGHWDCVDNLGQKRWLGILDKPPDCASAARIP